MLRDILVALHAGSGIVGLVAGLWTVVPPRVPAERRRPRRLYAVCIATLVVSLVMLIVVDWNDLDGAGRGAFLGLAGLGTVMVIRLVLASREVTAHAAGWQGRYLGHIYFTYVSLWIGFVILPVLDLPLPQLMAPLAAIGVLAIGNVLVGRVKRRVLVE